MRPRHVALVAAVFLFACGNDDGPTLYHRLGEEPGIRVVVDDLLRRVSADTRINGYFLNRSVDRGHLGTCLVRQIGHATGGPETYPDPPGTPGACRDMATAHHGHGISQADLDDFDGHLRDALAAAGISTADIDATLAALAPTDVVEDPTGTATMYQRIGRRPALDRIVRAFEQRIGSDPRVNRFFAGIIDPSRIRTCLIRLLCAADGPCRYGEEVDGEPGVSTDLPCRPMGPTHRGLRDGNTPIGIDHFHAVLEDMSATLAAENIAAADRAVILNTMAPTCPQVVAEPTTCP